MEEIKKNILENKESNKPSRVILEVGYGKHPIALFGNKELKENDCFISIEKSGNDYIDKNPKIALDKIIEGNDRAKANALNIGKNLLFIKADAYKMPFANQSINEVILCNFFDQGSNIGRFGDDGNDQFDFHEYQGGFIQQILRVLKPNGILRILEDSNRDFANKGFLKYLSQSEFQQPCLFSL